LSAISRRAEQSARGADDAAVVAITVAAQHMGRPVALDGHPEPVALGFGTDAFSCRLVGAQEPLWSGPLVVRLRPSAEAVDAEAAWHRWAEGQGFPAPRLLGTRRDGPFGVVVADPGLEPSIARMANDFAALPSIIGSLGRLQARLHSEPVTVAPGPVLDWPAAVGRLDAKLTESGAAGREPDMLSQRRWLGAHDPGPVVPVPCHGEFTPLNVHVGTSDASAAVVATWGEAALSDREYDLAATHLALWSSPYVAPERGHRRLLKLARAAVIAGYESGYRANGAQPDDGRMASWGAYHACYFSLVTATAPVPEVEENGWKPADLVKVRAGYRKDLAKRFALLAAEAGR
jgi:hypothetical protein